MADAIILSDPEVSFEAPWFQMHKEPTQWFERFNKYYLALGPTRTLMGAYLWYIQENDPIHLEEIKQRPPRSAGNVWSHKSIEWSWRERARAYDASLYQNAAKVIEEARTKISAATSDAVDALIGALANPRTAVSAAKEILDRGGVPSTTIHKSAVVHFSADDLNKAREELEAWEQTVTLENG